jgi:limonene-1,2-epoxide hydrolase
MGTNAELADQFLHAFWKDDRAALTRLATPDVVWDNVPFHAFALVDDWLEVSQPRARHGVDALRASKTMMFRDKATGRAVALNEDATSHQVISAAEAADGTVFQERFDTIGIGGGVIMMRCVGVFEFQGGRIAVWRDYFEHSHSSSSTCSVSSMSVTLSKCGKSDGPRLTGRGSYCSRRPPPVDGSYLGITG